MSAYYGRPILKAPVWKPAIGLYLFTGGLAGAAGLLSFVARLRGNPRLARRALLISTAGLAVSPPLLVADLGRPDRFHHMLRVFKPTSPMSVGSWILSGFGAATGAAVTSEALDALRPTSTLARVMRPLAPVAQAGAALLGPPLATYTAVLLADTSVPAWHEARQELPFIFAGSAAASAGGAAAIVTPAADAGPARRLAVGGAALELAASEVMKRRLDDAARPFREGRVKQLDEASIGLTAAGALLLAFLGRRRPAAIAGGALLMAGSLAKRFAIFRAGFESARQTTAR